MRAVRAALLLALAALPATAEDPQPANASPLPAPRLVGPNAGDEKKKMLQAGGGSSQTEAAVEAGLAWLARHQDEDGGWDADGFASHCLAGGKPCDGKGKGQHGEEMPCPFDDAISSLATLAFLSAGRLPGAAGDPYGAAVEKALLRIRRTGDVWSTAISTEAFAEAEARERKGRWREDALAGAERLLSMRLKDGGWGYAAGFREGSDVPYTALAVQALVAARDVGAKLPDDFASGVDAFLDSLEEKKGKLAYLVDGRQYGYTPTTTNAHLATAVRELVRAGLAGPRHAAHSALVAEEKPVWQISFREVNVPGRGRVQVQVGNLTMYQWWYGTLGKFQQGGSAWSGWFGAVKTALLPHQSGTGCEKGSWDPLGTYERQTGGRVFSTALGVLMLEQPYRHRRLSP